MPVVLVTGASRTAGLGAAIIAALVQDGWDIAFTHWSPADGPRTEPDGPVAIAAMVESAGHAVLHRPLDVADEAAISELFDLVEQELGPVRALVTCHTECEAATTLDATSASFDRHYEVNLRGTWLLIREFGLRFTGGEGGRIVTLTSDHVVGNLPYGATKAAADRITLAASWDLADKAITANALNPGPVDTGWMNDDHRADARRRTPLQRLATPQDTADIVRFLLSPQGGWITGQLLYSNGGMTSSIR